MTNSRKARIRRQRQRRALLTMALVLVTAFACIGGTIAWLTATTGPVTNTFTVGDIDIVLDEAVVGADGKIVDKTNRGNGNVYKVIPGSEYDKDPTVTVEGGSEACYLFVKFEQGNADTYFNYTSALSADKGWTQGDGTNIPSDVWYREVEAGEADQSWNLLVDDKIVVDADVVTKDTVDAAADAQLKWTAYACQKANIASAADAWAEVQP